MTTNKNEHDFVLHYFKAGRLNTVNALQQVKAKANIGPDSHRRTSLNRWIAAAASILLILSFGTYMALRPETTTLQTADMQQTYTLPDGTHVTLAPNSSLCYNADNCRNVEMQGRIYFQVKHDDKHPFDIKGEKAHVLVLGTQFEVDEHSKDSSSVFVTQGKVRFAALHGEIEGIILTRGMKAVLPNGSSRPVLSDQANINDVAWATHEFHFSDASMKEVLRVLGEYYGKTFTASDMSKRLTGDFDATDEKQVVRIIEETLQIVIRY